MTHGTRRHLVEAREELQPVPIRRPALKEIKAGRTDKPGKLIDEVGPPGYTQPALVDDEEATVEVKETDPNGAEEGDLEDDGYPDVLECS